MIGDYISVITPLLLHMLLSEAVVFFLGSSADVTTCTAITAVLVIPVAVWMYRRDRERQTEPLAAPGKSGRNLMKAGKTEKNPGTEGGHSAGSERESGRKGIAFGGFCFVAGAALNILWSGVLSWLRINEYFSNQTQEALLAAQVLVQIIGLGILAPIAEELIFRALIYQRMKRLMPLGAAMVLSSLLFAVYHGNMIQIIFAFPMSLVLVWVYERGKGFIFPVLFHMGANLAAVVLNLI